MINTVTVKFCNHNMKTGSRPAFDRLMQEPDLNVQPFNCLDQCDLCAEALFCMIGDEVVSAKTADELVTAVLAKLPAKG